MSDGADRRTDGPGRRKHDVDPELLEDLGRLAAAAGARVSALEDIGDDLDRLTASVDSLAASIGLMATKEEVQAVDRRQNRSRLILGGIIAVILLILLALPIAFTRSALNEIRDTGDYLVECTTPSPPPEEALDEDDLVHECYEDAQARQAAIVQTLNLSMLDAVYCARTTTDPADVEACFLDRLEARALSLPTPPDN